MVVINELIKCVNIDLGSAALSTCTACDVDGNGTVGINELVKAVNAALNGCASSATPSPSPGGAICGNGHMEEGEECDDGNNVGGDGCAANCTIEVVRMTDLDPVLSKSTVQLLSLKLTLTLTGHQALTSGKPRNTATIGPDGKQLFAVGEFPVVVKAKDVQFDPIEIPSIGCACVRGIEVPEFGPGNSGMGVVGCGDQHLTDVDFLVEQDHDTTPNRPCNSGSANGLPDDPQCNASSDLGAGITSNACLEGVGAACSTPDSAHIAGTCGFQVGACNSPRVITFSGGDAGRGATLLRNSTAIAQLQNTTSTPCVATKNPDGSCSAPDFGPDCTPCTDDDLKKGPQSIAPTTTGTASVVIYDTGDAAGVSLGDGFNCPPTSSTACIGSVTGSPTDCDAIMQDPNAPLMGTLVTAFPTIDSPMAGDIVVTTSLTAKNP
jgi:cysteine-rich repeat protein